MIVLRSFSKIFGLAGLRLGYALADPHVAHLLDVVQEPFNVNRIALAAGSRRGRRARSSSPARRAEVAEAREVLRDELARAGLRSRAVAGELRARRARASTTGPVCAALLRRGLLIRGGHEFGLPGFARVTIAPGAVMRRVARVEIADADLRDAVLRYTNP